MNEVCRNCNYYECACRNLDIIDRRHEYMSKTADMGKLEKFYNIDDTEFIRHSISLLRTGQFTYTLSIKKLTKHNPLHTYIQELPRDINNEIFAYLWQPNLIMDIDIQLPPNYPFVSCHWNVVQFTKNGKVQNSRDETDKLNCLFSESSISIKLYSEVLYYWSILSQNDS
jgi:hypothetical protein